MPTEYVQDGQDRVEHIPTAVKDLSLGNDYVMCFGRFSGRNFEIVLPIESIRAIYCRDSGQGLAFEDETFEAASEEQAATASPKTDDAESPRTRTVQAQHCGSYNSLLQVSVLEDLNDSLHTEGFLSLGNGGLGLFGCYGAHQINCSVFRNNLYS